MRGLVFVSLLLSASAWAEAPGATPTDPYASCLETRHVIYERASSAPDTATRGRMLAQMPTCQPGMAAVEVDAVGQAEAIAARTVVEISRERPWMIAFEPFAIRKHTFLFGVGYQVAPRLGVTLHGGIGWTEHVGVGDTYDWYYLEETDEAKLVSFTELQIGARAAYTLLPQYGIQVGGDVTYQHFGSPSPDRAVNPWKVIEGLGLSAFVGWKEVTKEGLTMELQVGPMLLAKAMTIDPMAVQGGNAMGLPPPGWDVDGQVHWYSSFMGGYSF